jgi:hypothetical protein
MLGEAKYVWYFMIHKELGKIVRGLKKTKHLSLGEMAHTRIS